MTHCRSIVHTDLPIAVSIADFIPISITRATDDCGWLKISTTGSDLQMKTLMDRMAQTIVDAQDQIAHDRVMAEMQIEQLETLTTEDDLLSTAVNLTKRK